MTETKYKYSICCICTFCDTNRSAKYLAFDDFGCLLKTKGGLNCHSVGKNPEL